MINITHANGGWTADIGAQTVFIPNDPENEQCQQILALIAGGLLVADPAPIETPAVLSREAFCVALISAGILTEAEAIDAALGAWPPKFEPALAGTPLVETLTIKNLWRETKTVSRDAPLFADLLVFYAAKQGLSEAEAEGLADQIFEITA